MFLHNSIVSFINAFVTIKGAVISRDGAVETQQRLHDSVPLPRRCRVCGGHFLWPRRLVAARDAAVDLSKPLDFCLHVSSHTPNTGRYGSPQRVLVSHSCSECFRMSQDDPSGDFDGSNNWFSPFPVDGENISETYVWAKSIQKGAKIYVKTAFRTWPVVF